MRRLVRIVARWWLAPMPPERLAAVRIACCSYATWYLFKRIDMLERLAYSDESLFAPVGLAYFLPGPINVELFMALVLATIVLGILAILGAAFRVTGPLFALLLLFVMSYRNSWSMIYHSHNALVIHAGIVAFTGAADRWSVDACIRRLRGRGKPGASWRYGWPVMLIGFVTIIPYLLSGIAKVLGPEGWGWASGESMRSQVIVNAIRYEVLLGQTQPFFEQIATHRWMFAFFGVLTLVIEFLAPLALLNRKLGFIWAFTAFAMHWGIYFVMGIRFRYQMSGLTYVSFINAEWLTRIRDRLFNQNRPDRCCEPDPQCGEGRRLKE